MVEPLNEFACKVNFTGKIGNSRPEWYKTPLRLNDEERCNPRIILEEFFQSYHLNDVREILWDWTVAVLSSPGSISIDHLDRNNHLFFYEKIEQLIEACWMIHSNEGQLETAPAL